LALPFCTYYTSAKGTKPTELTNLILGAGLNLLVALLIVRFIYCPSTHNRSYVFTFPAFNTVIFFVLGLLTSVSLSVGVGFGLFAIFSVLRYRTEEIPIREMTYLFVIIACR
jgi:Ca2+/Na+ antiporter